MRDFLLENIEALCSINGVSGDEAAVREEIRRRIGDACPCHTDPMGNLVGRKGKGGILLDAHTDEVGLIVTDITPEGYLKFATVGGMDERILPDTRVTVNGLPGVIGAKPIHLTHGDEGKKAVKLRSLAIDIGAESREEAEKMVRPGDIVNFERRFERFGTNKDFLLAPALDDRVGCAILLGLILHTDLDFDFSFSVQEEVGCRGASVVSAGCDATYALALETTTAADTGVSDKGDDVCRLGEGAVVSFMDRSTLYDREEYDLLLKLAAEKGIKVQPKRAVAGGNNMGAIHKAGGGKHAAALSVPARYLHSPAVVVNVKDVLAQYALAEAYVAEHNRRQEHP